MGQDADEEEARLTRHAAVVSSAVSAAIPRLLARRPLAFAAPTPAVTASSRAVRRPPPHAPAAGLHRALASGRRPPSSALCAHWLLHPQGGREKRRREGGDLEAGGREKRTGSLFGWENARGRDKREREEGMSWAGFVIWAERGGGEEAEYFNGLESRPSTLKTVPGSSTH